MAKQPIVWDIRREGRAWAREEAWSRYELVPEKTEMVGGKLFWSDEDRVSMLGLLLENVGIDAALRLGDLATWRAALTDLERERSKDVGGAAD